MEAHGVRARAGGGALPTAGRHPETQRRMRCGGVGRLPLRQPAACCGPRATRYSLASPRPRCLGRRGVRSSAASKPSPSPGAWAPHRAEPGRSIEAQTTNLCVFPRCATVAAKARPTRSDRKPRLQACPQEWATRSQMVGSCILNDLPSGPTVRAGMAWDTPETQGPLPSSCHSRAPAAHSPWCRLTLLWTDRAPACRPAAARNRAGGGFHMGAARAPRRCSVVSGRARHRRAPAPLSSPLSPAHVPGAPA